MVSSLCTPSRHSRALSMRPWEEVTEGENRVETKWIPSTLAITTLWILLYSELLWWIHLCAFRQRGKQGVLWILISFYFFFILFSLFLHYRFELIHSIQTPVSLWTNWAKIFFIFYFYLWLGRVIFSYICGC